MAKVSLRAYNREVEAMIDQGQLDGAIAHCQHILKSFPKHLETYRLLGKAYLEYKRYKDAVDIFSRVLAAEPNDFVSNVGMSIIRDEENKLDDAIWHMERAFEVQSANPAIQSELQRLYGRRDGTHPSRIRMTRGALAHMYVQGELYPQAISEIKSVLKEDHGRNDMQVLLARAYFKSGQKNDAAEAANSVLRRYPYCLDANRVLVEILGTDRPESIQTYRQRVVELDPYAAQVTGSIFQSNEVGDNAVVVERLDWNGQPIPAQSDWNARAIASESGQSHATKTEQDWLNRGFEPTPATPPTTPVVVPPLPAASATFDFAASTPTPQEIPATPADDIPDFLRAAGWGNSTGTFDESKSTFADEPAPAVGQTAPLEQGELPDWVKAMMPSQTESAPVAQTESQPASAQEEELPDWIKNIGAGTLAATAVKPDEAPDWLQTDQPAAPAETPDWLKSADQPADAAPLADVSMDWLSDLGQPAASSATEDAMDWLDSNNAATSADQPDWLKGAEPVATPEAEDSMDWLKPNAPMPADQPDWLNLTEESTAGEPSATAESHQPDWLTQFGGSTEQPSAPVAPTAKVEDLGKSQQETDDALAWLENLAAKQGATEGLLVKPEDRKSAEPEWVTQAKSAPVEQPMASTAKVDDLGKSQQETDDALAWLENLAAKQGATEGLLVKPEDRKEAEPEWVTQAKSAPVEQPTSASDDAPAWLQDIEQESEQTSLSAVDETTLWLQGLDQSTSPSVVTEAQPLSESAAVDDMPAWLHGLDEEEKAQPEPVADATAMWFQKLEEPEPTPQPEPAADDLPAWLQGLDADAEKVPVVEADVPAREAVGEFDWLNEIEDADSPTPAPVADVETPGWLKGMDEEAKLSAAPDDRLQAWMHDETGEVVAEPTKIEPTRPSDWHPVDEKQAEPVAHKPEPVAEKPKPAARKPKPTAEPKPEPYREPVTALRGTGMSNLAVDANLASARAELSRSNIPGALDGYGKLIKKGKFLDEVIYDLREALDRFPVEVSILQSLGDAYMRANRLQDALDAYTKAEELLR